MLTIKDIPVEERPRERLINYGTQSLNNEELLAIILQSGTKNISAKNLANQLLNKIGNIKKLSNINYELLLSINGIGPAKACIILASIELGRRINKEIPSLIHYQITNCEDVYNYFKDIFNGKYQEYFYCIYLDNKKRIINIKQLFIGTLNYSLVHPREIFKEAYLLNSTGIICVHNHPSGDVTPSKEDINLTNRLIESGNLLGIKILDHLIIGNKYYSFLENGLI